MFTGMPAALLEARNSQPGLHGVTVHSPDPTRYVRADSSRSFIIPPANIDGSPRVFEPHRPGVAVIDPGDENPNWVDFGKTTPDEITDVMKDSENPIDALQKLASLHQAAATPPAPSVPAAPLTNMLPPLSVQPLPMQFAPPPAPFPQAAQPPVLMPQPVPSRMTMPSITPEVLALLTQFGFALQAPAFQLPPAVSPPVPPPSPAMPAPVNAPAPAPDLGNALQVPWLTLQATPPRVLVHFNLKAGGFLQSRYHGVIETEGLVLLIFDSRFEYSSQFIPPITSEETGTIEIQIDGKRHEVHHLPLMDFDIGVFQCCILFKVTANKE